MRHLYGVAKYLPKYEKMRNINEFLNYYSIFLFLIATNIIVYY